MEYWSGVLDWTTGGAWPYIDSIIIGPFFLVCGRFPPFLPRPSGIPVVMIYVISCWLFPYLFPVSLFLVTYLYFLYLECALRQLDLLF